MTSAGFWCVVYLLIGVLWGAWMMRSQIGHAQMRQSAQWWSFVLFLVVVMLWPIAMLLYAVLRLYIWKKRREAMRRLAEEHPELLEQARRVAERKKEEEGENDDG